MRAGRIEAAHHRKIDLGRGQREETGQKVAATRDAQGGFAVQRHIGDVAIGISQKNIVEGAPASPARNGEHAEISRARVGIDLA